MAKVRAERAKEEVPPKKDAQAKKFISMSTLFKRGGLEKKKQKTTQKPEHPLATALSNTLEQSKEQIAVQVETELAAAIDSQILRLKKTQGRVSQQEKQVVHDNEPIAQDLNELELEWESHDKSRSGETSLRTRIKKFERVLKTEEGLISRDSQKLTDLNAEIRTLAVEVIDRDGYEQLLAGTFEWTTWTPMREDHTLVDVEAEKTYYVKLVEETNRASMKAMKESETKLNLRHDKIQQSFYAMFRDDEN